jgi:TolB-like protein
VVLPFTNLSGDPTQEYFADGMVEDITIALGHLPWLFVIASASAFTYKGRAVDVRQVGADLGVRYVLKGSVRKDANRVRITAQLSDASHGGHIWADRFDGELDNVFDLQERLAAQVSTTIAPALRSEQVERTWRKPTENQAAYDLFLRAFAIYRQSFAQSQEALRLLYRAIEHDPSYGAAYGLAAFCYLWQKMNGWLPPTDPRLNEGIRFARLAAESGSEDSEALWMAAQAFTLLAGETTLALRLVEKSLLLNPNSANAWWANSTVNVFLGDMNAGLEHAARARRLNPLDSLAFGHWMASAFAHFFAGRYDEALKDTDEALARDPAFPSTLRLRIAICGQLGRVEEARDLVKRLLAINPDASVSAMRAYYEAPLRQNPAAMERLLTGLRAGGLPEG